jgi:hypothetical protein
MARIQVDDKLKIAFNFNNSDLQDNRQGFMSFRQKRKLRLLSLLKIDWIFAVFAGTVAIFIPAMVIAGYRLELITIPLTIFEGLIAIVYAVFPVLGYAVFLCFSIIHLWNTNLYHWTKSNDDIRSGQVNNIQIQIDSRRRSGFWFLGGEACIKLTPEQLFVLHDNYIYRLYYAPNTCEILSVEIVHVDRGPRDKL